MKIKIILLFILYTTFVLAAKLQGSGTTPLRVGGFGAPIYFKSIDNDKILQIKRNKSVKLIKIAYPKSLNQLAFKIGNSLSDMNVEIQLIPADIKDSKVVKYRHDTVSVTEYF